MIKRFLKESMSVKKDSHQRSLIKAFGYRTMGIILLATLTWIFTRDFIQMGLITGVYHGLSVIGYYIYERLWTYIRWVKMNSNQLNQLYWNEGLTSRDIEGK